VLALHKERHLDLFVLERVLPLVARQSTGSTNKRGSQGMPEFCKMTASRNRGCQDDQVADSAKRAASSRLAPRRRCVPISITMRSPAVVITCAAVAGDLQELAAVPFRAIPAAISAPATTDAFLVISHLGIG